MLPVAQRYGMGALSCSPLAGGWLTGRYRTGRPAPTSSGAERLPARYNLSDPDNQRKLEAAEALAVLAENAGLSLIHLAPAFVLAHPAVTTPIIGPRTMEQLESQLGTVDVTLTTDEPDAIDDIIIPRSHPRPRRQRLPAASATRSLPAQAPHKLTPRSPRRLRPVDGTRAHWTHGPGEMATGSPSLGANAAKIRGSGKLPTCGNSLPRSPKLSGIALGTDRVQRPGARRITSPDCYAKLRR
jgi:Aldo/keto reductase family